MISSSPTVRRERNRQPWQSVLLVCWFTEFPKCELSQNLPGMMNDPMSANVCDSGDGRRSHGSGWNGGND